jgi:hypothetical protein
MGTIQVIGGPLLLRGLALRPASGTPAVIVTSSIVLCEDCEIFGAIEVKGAAKVYLKNCLVKSEQHGLDLSGGAFAEVITSRITGIPAGVVMSEGSSADLYHCRVEGCHGSNESDTGAGVFAQSSSLHAEGTEFFSNQVGVYLKACTQASFLACHFHDNSVSGMITEGTPAEGILSLWGCQLDGTHTSDYPTVSLEGGQAKLAYVQVQAYDKIGMSITATAMGLEGCKVSSEEDVAMEFEGGSLASRDSILVSQRGPGIRLSKTKGSIQGGTVSGTPPIDTAYPNNVSLVDVAHTLADPSETEGGQTELTLESIPTALSEIVGQNEVKSELQRLLRLTFAAKERNRRGILQEPHQFSGIVTGPPLIGQLRAIQIFAALLHKLGDLSSPEVLQVSLTEASLLNVESVKAGFVFVTTDDGSGTPLMSAQTAEVLLRLSAAFEGRAYVLIGGDREALHAMLRSNVELSREFPIELPFAEFHPGDLVTLFANQCKREKIAISLNAAKKLPVIFHGLHDRLQRRFLNMQGVAELFSDARRKYLERCSHAGRFDLELENEDIVVPLDRASATAIERSPELVAMCTSCKEQTPWLPGLDPDFHCAHCGAGYTATWGLLKNSTFFRKRNIQGRTIRSGAVAAIASRRRAIPATRS